MADSVYDGQLLDISEKYNELCRDLLKARFDYNYIDDDTILKGNISDGRLECGRTSYSVIVMAYANIIDPDVLDKLIEFEKAGGCLIWVDMLPESSTVLGKSDDVRAKAAGFKNSIVKVYSEGGSFSELTGKLSGILKYSYSVSGDEAVLTSPYTRDGKQIIVAVNTLAAKKTLRVTFDDDPQAEYDIYDLYSGEISTGSGSQNMIIDGYRAVIIVKDGASEPVVDPDPDNGNKAQNDGKKFPTVPVIIAGSAAVLAAAGVTGAVIAKKKRSEGSKE